MSKRLLLALLIVAAFFLGTNVANRLMVARAVSAPNADSAEVIRLAAMPQYEIAAPHRTLFKELRLQLIPGAAAQLLEDCDCTETKAMCNTSCPFGHCGECPDCWNGPCVIYKCAATTNLKKKCVEKMSTTPACATSCRNDKNVTCRKPESCIGDICP